MCMRGGGSPKEETPKPSPLPPPLPPPPPPKPAEPPPRKVLSIDDKPDIRVGAAKASTSSRSTRSASRESRGSKSLSIGNNQGMTL